MNLMLHLMSRKMTFFFTMFMIFLKILPVSSPIMCILMNISIF